MWRLAFRESVSAPILINAAPELTCTSRQGKLLMIAKVLLGYPRCLTGSYKAARTR